MYRASKIHKKPCFKIARGEKTQCRKHPPDAIFSSGGQKEESFRFGQAECMGPAGSGGADHQALDLAVLAEILDGGHGADVIAVVDGVVIGLGVADDEGIGDLEPLKEETVAEEHVDALRAVGVELGLPGVLGAVVHEDGSGGEAFAQGHGILVDHGLDELFDECHGNTASF